MADAPQNLPEHCSSHDNELLAEPHYVMATFPALYSESQYFESVALIGITFAHTTFA